MLILWGKMEINTANFLKRLKADVPECKLFETEGEPVIGATVHFEDLSAFLNGKTKFVPGKGEALTTFTDPDWTALVDYWLKEDVGILVTPKQFGWYEIRIYPHRKSKTR